MTIMNESGHRKLTVTSKKNIPIFCKSNGYNCNFENICFMHV